MKDKPFVVLVVNWSPVGVSSITCSLREKFYTLPEAENFIQKNISDNPTCGQFVILEYGNGSPKLVYADP